MNEKIYEMLFIVPAELEEEEQQQALETVEKFITDQGTLYEMKEWKKRRLAFPIRHVNEGVYHLAYFTAPSGALARISTRLHQTETVLRHSILRIDETYRKAGLPMPFKAQAEPPVTEEADHV